MKRAMLIGLALCSGCAQIPPQVEVRQVRVPVPVPCIDAGKVPRASFPGDAELAKLPDGPLVAALAKDRLDRAAHIAQLEAVMQGCTTGGKP